MGKELLKIENLKVSYGPIVALKGISLTVNEGEIVTLIGANGAGKTTTMNTIMGLVKPSHGKIVFDGHDITKAETRSIVKMGCVLSPEGRQVFPELTVGGNLEMGGLLRTKQQVAEGMEKVFAMFPRLKERINQQAGTLSGGEQQMLAIGRAMMAEPKMLLLDEPSMGIAPFLVQEIFELLKKIREDGTTILLVEQNAKKALSISDRAYALETGRIFTEGSAKELMESEEIIRAYLGG